MLLMISIKSLLMYLIINGSLLMLSFLHWSIINFTQSPFVKILSFFLRNILLLKVANLIMYYNNINTYEKKSVCVKYSEYFKYFLYLSFASGVEYAVINYVHNLGSIEKYTYFDILIDLIMFVPVSFIFELIFDLVHYWSHRLLHSNPLLYQYIHKTHHTHINITPIITYVQHPLDLVLSNVIPSIVAIKLTEQIFSIQMSLFLLMCIMMYKTYIEILGHTDIKTKRTGSFVQFVWITRLLDIQLFSKHHLIHHSHVMYNFSKRFSLWDKLFGTFKNE